jgi:hypothetical protein
MMEKCINSKVQKLLKEKQNAAGWVGVREGEMVYDRLFHCLDTLYDYGWMRRDEMRKIKARLVKQLTDVV